MPPTATLQTLSCPPQLRVRTASLPVGCPQAFGCSGVQLIRSNIFPPAQTSGVSTQESKSAGSGLRPIQPAACCLTACAYRADSSAVEAVPARGCGLAKCCGLGSQQKQPSGKSRRCGTPAAFVS
eukprot:1904937-Pleurochrysis_carterae.AAC.1